MLLESQDWISIPTRRARERWKEREEGKQTCGRRRGIFVGGRVDGVWSGRNGEGALIDTHVHVRTHTHTRPAEEGGESKHESASSPLKDPSGVVGERHSATTAPPADSSAWACIVVSMGLSHLLVLISFLPLYEVC